MRTACRSLFYLIILAGACQAQVVVDSDIQFNLINGGPGQFPNYVGWIAQHPGQNGTSVWFEYAWGNVTGGWYSLRATNTNLDEGSHWYIVPSGATFSREAINNNSFPILMDYGWFVGDHYPPQPIPYGDFFLGVRTGRGLTPNAWDIYGWVKLRNNGYGLYMISNACAYGVSGIVVGTTQTVPEPMPLGAICLVPLAAFFRTRRTR